VFDGRQPTYPANVLTIQYPETIRKVTNAAATRLATVRCRCSAWSSTSRALVAPTIII
jgi:hypothetical protein